MSPPHGLTTAELLRDLGLAAAATGILALVLIEFVFRARLRRETYHWLLLWAVLVLPGVAMLGVAATALEETKTVESCATCHVMHPFVNDLKNPASETLAARHYRNKWIPDQQCYTCHTSYGLHGTFEAKKAGMRHWYLYVTRSWKEPIRYNGTYPNANCLTCHGDTPKYTAVELHTAIASDLASNQSRCLDCHGPAHPEPAEHHASGSTDE